MQAAIVCREMKWTYEEYRSQPIAFITVLCKLFNAEAENAKRQNKNDKP